MLVVTTRVFLDPFRQLALVVMSVCALALLETVTIPVNHNDATDQSNILGARAGHSSFEQVGVVFGRVDCPVDHVEEGVLHVTRELFTDALLESALVAGLVGLGNGTELGGAG